MQDKTDLPKPNFNIGDLIILPKGAFFLERKWLYDPSSFGKTIRPEHYIDVKENTCCVILDKNRINYDVLVLTEDLLCKSLVIFVYFLDRAAQKLG